MKQPLHLVTYGIDNLRRKTEYFVNGTSAQTKYFIGSYEEEVTATNTRKIHYLSGGAVFIMDNTNPNGKMYYTYGDYLGSILAITDDAGTVLEEQSFDPWGRRRNVTNWTYTNVQAFTLLDRGYTGHQHLYEFGIINMNGRLYDPVLGRILSPDPYIQMPGYAQNYNRYSYVWNNPLKYTDPDGEWIAPVLTALLNMYWNGLTSNGFQFNPAKWDWSSPSTYGNLALGAYNGYQIGANLEGSYKNISGTPTGNSKPVWSEEFQSLVYPETDATFQFISQGYIRQVGTNEAFAKHLSVDWQNVSLNFMKLTEAASDEYSNSRNIKNAEFIAGRKAMVNPLEVNIYTPEVQTTWIDPKYIDRVKYANGYSKVIKAASASVDVITTANFMYNIGTGNISTAGYVDGTVGTIGLANNSLTLFRLTPIPIVGEFTTAYGVSRIYTDTFWYLGEQYQPISRSVEWYRNRNKIKRATLVGYFD